MTDSPTDTSTRIRWGWFAACILLGSAGILIGMVVAPPEDRSGYLAGVLGGVGTTLLLVGVVLLLERRIIDSAVKVVRDAAEEARIRSDRVMREQVHDLEDRITDLWATTETAEEVARKQEETSRMAHEFTERVVNEYTGEPELNGPDPDQGDARR